MRDGRGVSRIAVDAKGADVRVAEKVLCLGGRLGSGGDEGVGLGAGDESSVRTIVAVGEGFGPDA